MSRFLRHLVCLLHRSRKEAEIREELEFHLETEADEQRASGLPEEQALRAATRHLGNMTLVQEDTRAVWGWTVVEQALQDLRYAARTMASNRTFTGMAALSLALGIGANTAIYSFMESILLRSLPVPDPASLVVMKWRAREFPSIAKGISGSTGGTHNDVFPYPALPLFQNNSDVLARAFCYAGAGRLSVTTRGETETVNGQYVSGDYFRGMGVPPAAGRLLGAEDDEASAAAVAVLNYRYSQRRFGEAGDAVGQSIRINDVPFTLVGVAPPGFFGADPGSVPDVYVPMHANLLMQPEQARQSVAARYSDRNNYWIAIIGRLKPGVTRDQAQSILGPQFRRFAANSASIERERENLPELTVLEGAAGFDSLRRRYSKPLYVLMSMAGLILLIACANIANLLLARAMARRREIAVRLGMGAGRLRVVRQLLTESALLAAIGGALGIAFAHWGIRFLTLLLGTGREGFTLHAELNWHVLGATLGLSLLTGLLFGLIPAIHATRMDLMPALKETRTETQYGGLQMALARLSLSRILVVAQTALSLLLVVAAGLFDRTLSNLQSIQLGFNRENVLLFTIRPGAMGYEPAALNRLYIDLRQRLSQIPGVRSVSLSNGPLLSGSGTWAPITVPGATARVRAGLFDVGPGFFETMQISLAAGREFDERDGASVSPVAIVNHRFARSFGLENPLGRTFILGSNNYRIVGVVGDALFLNLKEDRQAMVYFSALTPRPPSRMTYQVRAAGNPLAHASAARQIVREIDSRLAVSDLKTQGAQIDEAINQEITLAWLCTAFAALALAIACVGLYGTVAFNVTRRTGEIGIRMALGARRKGIIWLVLREVVAMSLVGFAIAVPVVLAASRYVEPFLFGIKANDPVTMATAAGGLFAAVLAAGYLPARRASRIDPMAALRQ